MKTQFDSLSDFVKHFTYVGSCTDARLTGLVVNKTVLVPVDDDRNASIELVTDGTHKKWEGFTVTIIHKMNGRITSQYFPFQDYLIEDKTKPHPCSDARWYVWNQISENKYGFYGKQPTQESLIDMRLAIITYINLWK